MSSFPSRYSDGANQALSSCQRDFRNKPYPVRAKITYYQKTLTVSNVLLETVRWPVLLCASPADGNSARFKLGVVHTLISAALWEVASKLGLRVTRCHVSCAVRLDSRFAFSQWMSRRAAVCHANMNETKVIFSRELVWWRQPYEHHAYVVLTALCDQCCNGETTGDPEGRALWLCRGGSDGQERLLSGAAPWRRRRSLLDGVHIPGRANRRQNCWKIWERPVVGLAAGERSCGRWGGKVGSSEPQPPGAAFPGRKRTQGFSRSVEWAGSSSGRWPRQRWSSNGVCERNKKQGDLDWLLVGLSVCLGPLHVVSPFFPFQFRWDRIDTAL